MRWRPALRAVHRDLGYFLTVLVCIYSISGLAVNHIDDFNPNYAIENRDIDIGPLGDGDLDALQATVAERLDIDPASVRGRHLISRDQLRIFLPEGGEVKVSIATGKGLYKDVRTRTILFEFNVLHLNHMKGAWTWFADAVAILLLVLALTGLVMLGGRKGLAGRGKWFALAGLVVPVAFVVVYHLQH